MADIIQVANWKMDESLRQIWCGGSKAKNTEVLNMFRRQESRNAELKLYLKIRFTNDVKKGPKLAAVVHSTLLHIPMGSLWAAAECSYNLPGQDLAENVLMKMRCYPDSDVLVHTPDFILNVNSCANLEIRKSNNRKASTLHSELRTLFTIFGVDVNSTARMTTRYTFESRVGMQDISVHVVGVCEYILQCLERVSSLEELSSAQKRIAEWNWWCSIGESRSNSAHSGRKGTEEWF